MTFNTRTSLAAAVSVLMLSACGNMTGSVTSDATTPVADWVAELQDDGHTASAGPEFQQPFFIDATAQEVTLDNTVVQVFAFETKAEAVAAASTVAEDGNAIGATQISWLSDAHFFQDDLLLAIYIENDANTVSALEDSFGPPFAGTSNE